MASSFNTLQRRELLSHTLCKCFSTSSIPQSHHSFAFSSPKHALPPFKLSPFFLVNAPVTLISPVNSKSSSRLDCNSSTETVDFRDFSDNLGSGYSSSSGQKGEKNGGGFVDYGKNNRNSGGKLNFRKRTENGSEISSAKRRSRKWERKMEEIVGKVAINSNVEDVKGDYSGFEKKSQKGSGVSSRSVRDANSMSKVVNRSVDRGAIRDGGDASKVKKKDKLSKKCIVNSPEFHMRNSLDMCSKRGDVLGAISLYDSAVKQGIKMGQYHYTVLLYLCSSAAMGVVRPAKSGSGSRSLDAVPSQKLDGTNDSGEEEDDDIDDEARDRKDQTQKLEVNEIRVSDDVKKYARKKGFEIYERMCLDKVQMNEAALTSVARMAMGVGDGDKAFDMVKEMISIGITPKLRSYGPALSVFTSNGDIEKAFAVEKHMLENGVYPEEPELEALLRVSVEAGKADRVYYVLHKLRTVVRFVSPSTADLIEKWFNSKQASRIGKRKWDHDMITQTMENVGGGWHGQGWLGRGKWSVSRTSIGVDGLCRCCGEKLALIDLDPDETERFAESVAAIAAKREKHSRFQKFQRWLDYYGPFEAVVDAANVGLFSQRNFQPGKVNAIVNGLRQMLPSRKWPLIILHNRRVTGSKLDKPMNKEYVEKWKNADALYATPTGSNDDWYWLYAAIKFKCLLVTNDEMRDHTFQLLGNDFFPKWKERHQVRFSFSEIGPIFHMPPPCSVVIQGAAIGIFPLLQSTNMKKIEHGCVPHAQTLISEARVAQLEQIQQKVKAPSAACCKKETDIVVPVSHRDLRNTLSGSSSSKSDHLPFLNAIKGC